MDIRKVVGDNIRHIRNDRGYSLEELSVITGMSKTYIGDVERATMSITVVALEKIANALKAHLPVFVTVKGYQSLGIDPAKQKSKKQVLTTKRNTRSPRT